MFIYFLIFPLVNIWLRSSIWEEKGWCMQLITLKQSFVSVIIEGWSGYSRVFAYNHKIHIQYVINLKNLQSPVNIDL